MWKSRACGTPPSLSKPPPVVNRDGGNLVTVAMSANSLRCAASARRDGGWLRRMVARRWNVPLPVILARVRPIATGSTQPRRATLAKKEGNRTTASLSLLGTPVPQITTDLTQAVTMTSRTTSAINCDKQKREAVQNCRTQNEESDPENLHGVKRPRLYGW